MRPGISEALRIAAVADVAASRKDEDEGGFDLLGNVSRAHTRGISLNNIGQTVWGLASIPFSRRRTGVDDKITQR